MSVSHRYEPRVLSYREQLLQIEDFMSRAEPKVFDKRTIDGYIEMPDRIVTKLPDYWVRSSGDLHELLAIFYRAKQEFEK